MPQLFPFRGIHFDPDRVGGDLGPVLAPPYDVVGDEDARRLEASHPYNAVRLELGIPPANPDPARYEQAAARWSSWQADGVLVRDPVPSLYVYRHSFTCDGKRFVRTALVGLLGDGALPHEETMAAPKQDRLDLLRACGAQFSPILVLYEDPGNRVKSQVDAMLTGRSPALAAHLQDDEIGVWRLDDRAGIAGVTSAIAASRAVIADGHHRYESVRRFIGEKAAGSRRRPVLAALVAVGDGGLAVLPTHRLVRAGCAAGALVDSMSCALGSDGEVTPLDPPAGHAGWPSRGAALLRSLAGSSGGKTTIVAAGRDRAWTISAGLDAAGMLETLDRVLGDAARASRERGTGITVEYTHDGGRALREVADARAEIAFIVPPVTVDEVFRKACLGYRFPRKTTYFHPKAPAGLLMCDLCGCNGARAR